jgi:hypothetical protein
MLSPRFWRAIVVAALIGAPCAGLGQTVDRSALDAFASANSEDVTDTGDEDAGPQPELDEAALANALSTGRLPSPDAKQKSLRVLDLGLNEPSWSKTGNSDGSAKYSVNKSLAAPWDAKIGADISVAPPPTPYYDPRPLPSTISDAGNGNAWANVAVPHLATVEVHAQPANDYDRVGTKLERTLPFGKSLSLTVQSSFDFTDFRAPQGATSASVLPASAASRAFDADKSLQLNILSSGTTFSAGSTKITGDPITHNRVSAAQKIYGPLTVTGSINDIGQPSGSRSISAGLNLSW